MNRRCGKGGGKKKGGRGDVIELTRHAQQHKVPRAGIIQDLQLAKVAVHDALHQRVVLLQPPRVPDVVDAHPHAEERVVGRPGRVVGLVGDAAAELRDLVDEAQHGRLPGGHERGVGGGAAVGEVVREQRRPVELRHQEAHPVEPPARRPPGQRRVAERVVRRRLGARHVEARLRVRVAAGEGWESVVLPVTLSR